MEGIFNDSRAAEIIKYDLNAGVMFFPVRHHSPVCSYQLLRAAAEYKPDIILIEGPENANHLIPILTDDKTALPAAFYYFYKDKKKLLDEDMGDYKCYYPFMYSSPEYNAMKIAAQNGVPAAFIDLPYYEILINTRGRNGLRSDDDKHSYADDSRLKRSSFYKRICEKTGLRDFEEFWEKYFEIEGLRLSTEKFFVQMHTYCYLTRIDTPEEELKADATLAREQYMASNIKAAMEKYERVLVVTGGFHSPGLYQLINGGKIKPPKLHKIPEDLQGVFPTAYSYEAADALHGYASGMKYPGFYDSVMNALLQKNSPEGVYDELSLDLLVKTAKESSKQDIAVSIADISSARSVMTGLAALRNVSECGISEVKDGVTACLIKGEKTVSSALPLDIMAKLATGDGVGHIGDKSHTPPLVADFEEQCEKFKLKYKSVVPQELDVALFGTAKGLELSRFLHRTEFLGTGFAQMLKGPDLHSGKDRSRVREEWRYKRTPNVDAVLIDCTTDGFTIEEACKNIALKRLAAEGRCAGAAQVAVSCFLMGIPMGQSEKAVLENILANDGDFFSVGEGLRYFETLYDLQQLYEFEDSTVKGYIEKCVSRLIATLSGMATATDDQAGACVKILKLMYGVTEGLMSSYRDDFEAALLTLTEAEEKEPSIYGAAMGLLYAIDNSRRQQAEEAMMGYLRGSSEIKKRGSGYLKGLFATARDIVLADDTFLKLTNELISTIDYPDFMEILPAMRLAFSYFTPAEIQSAAKAVARLNNMDDTDILDGEAIDEGLFIFGRGLDIEITELMKGGR